MMELWPSAADVNAGNVGVNRGVGGTGRRVCLLTTGQPSTNPRLVKEADALSASGHAVHVIGAQWTDWADESDRRLLASRPWSCTVIDWRRRSAPMLFWKSRIRHRAALAGMQVPAVRRWATRAALSRVTPELIASALQVRADLYIAHNLGALPAALTAARRFGARLGFDAEDFHSGEFTASDPSPRRAAIERAEQSLLPWCDYVTAAAPGIADAYAKYCERAGRPECVLNVFPLDSRPSRLRPTAALGPLRLYWFSQTIGAARGLEDVVRAAGRLPDGTVEIHLRGRWQAGYQKVLQQVARDSGLSIDRLFSYPPGHPDDMVRLAADFDVGLALEPGTSPNSDIALSNKIFTCLLAGAALIATRTRGQAELIPRLGHACVSYTPGDVSTLSDILYGWVRDRQLLAAAREAAWQLGETQFNWDREKHVFLHVVDQTLSHRVPA